MAHSLPRRQKWRTQSVPRRFPSLACACLLQHVDAAAHCTPCFAGWCQHQHLQPGMAIISRVFCNLERASPARHKQLTVIAACRKSTAAGTGSTTFASQGSQLLLALLSLHLLIGVQASVGTYEQAMTASFSQLSTKLVVCLHHSNMFITCLGWKCTTLFKPDT